MAKLLRGEYRSAALSRFVTGLMAEEHPALRRIRLETPKKGLPPIGIGPDERKLLDFLVRACGAKKAVEVGTLAGYSACWIARALPEGGRLLTMEYSPKHAEVARANIRAAKLADKIEVRVGAAAKTLRAIEDEGPFDFCFIDADKANYAVYLRWAARHLRSGGIVAADNAYLFGKLHLAPSGMRAALAIMADTELFSSCAMIPTGEGMAVAVRR